MRFESAFRQLRKGKMIGRKAWKPETFCYLKDNEFYRPVTDEGVKLAVLYTDDLLAEDWICRTDAISAKVVG